MITSKHKRMDLTQAINAYIWDNSSRGKMFEGIFDFQEVSSYIEKHIKNRINLGVKKFIDEMFKLNEEKLDIYIDIIHEETQEEKTKIIAAIKSRLTNAFYGLFGEHVLSNMISNSNKYRVKNLTAQDDYEKAIDICNAALQIQEGDDAYYYLGKAYLGNQDEEKAKVAYISIKENYPDSSHLDEVNDYLSE